ncbi:DEKNAAC100085 [Brettanomyces naardenensis]|uniref:non-specific serine/threonine protein kinase n=1 Tax=Brettanomyces naardenensis TaxID=13370 RepID=A0A448YET5_BRENA|nr:DEKNAAC100085 [Brettanomyces naardenensis]
MSLPSRRSAPSILTLLCSLLLLSSLLISTPLAEHSADDNESWVMDKSPNDENKALSRQYDFSGILPKGIDDIKVTNLLLASDIEGNLHALNRHTGELVWSLVGDGALVSIVSNQVVEKERLVHTTPTNFASQSPSTFSSAEKLQGAQTSTVNGATGGSDTTYNSNPKYASADMTWIIEPFADGTIYHFTPENGLQKLPASIEQLVMKSPFSLGDDFIYTGVRRSGIVKVNARTGKLVGSYGMDGRGDSSNSSNVDGVDQSKFADDDEGHEFMSSGFDLKESDETILLGKTTYELMIHSKNDSSWNITYTTWGPNNLHTKLAEQNYESTDNLYIQPFHDSSLLALDASSKTVKWVASLPYVTVNVFDLFYDEETSLDPKFIVLPHPLNSEYAMDSDESRDDDSTYIERTKEGSWFAMGESHYPSLVRSAPVAKYISNERWRVPSMLSNSELLGIAITGVHDGSLRAGHGRNHNSNRLEVYDPLQLPSVIPTGGGAHRHPNTDFRYRNWDSVYKPPDSMRYYHDRLAIEGTSESSSGVPSEPVYRFSSWKKLVYRAFENVVVACIGILILLVLTKLGVFQSANRLLNTIGLGKRNDNRRKEVTFADPAQEDSEGDEIELTDKVDGSSKEGSSPLEERVDPGIESSSQQQQHEQSRRRKRGSRGGKKNKKKEAVTVITTSAIESTDSDTTSGSGNGDNAKKVVEVTVINPSLSITNTVLGYGSHGTVVFKGSFEERPVAVKRMLIDFYKIASQEIKLLQESDDHLNVIRYFCSQQADRFLYIALELCTASLEDIIEKKSDECKKISGRMDPANVLWQIANGLNHLHALKIVHRDIKPQNILVAESKKLRGKEEFSQVRILISDFGLCKKLEADQSSFRATTAQGAGTSGWRAPELLADDVGGTTASLDSSGDGHTDGSIISTNRRLTKAIDIFSTGCVFYHFLTGGSHPFGDKYSREGNIIKGNYDLSLLDGTPYAYESKDLISSMISHDPNDRPDTAAVMKHPYFWPVSEKLNFLLKVSDRFEVERRDPPSRLLLLLEASAPKVIGKQGWRHKFDDRFLDNLGKYRKYSGDKLMDLLRAMRNKYHHFKDLPEDLAVDMGPLPDGFYAYFVSKFPNLLMVIYELVDKNLKDDELLSGFF